jgi:hypothetical protein
MVTLAVVPDGQAATVSIAHQGEGYGLNWTLWVVAQPGERNEIVVSYGATGIRVTDSVPLSAGDHCALQLDGSVVCQPLPGGWESSLHVRAGDLDDTVRFDTPSTSSTYLVGGPGDDVLSGGGVHAEFTGGGGDDTMTGGPRHDLFHEGRAANGSDAMTEGPGADRYDRSGSFTPHALARFTPTSPETPTMANQGSAIGSARTSTPWSAGPAPTRSSGTRPRTTSPAMVVATC